MVDKHLYSRLTLTKACGTYCHLHFLLCVTCDGDRIFSLTLTGANSSLCLLFYSSQGLIEGGGDICYMPWSFNSKCSHMILLESLSSHDPVRG